MSARQSVRCVPVIARSLELNELEGLAGSQLLGYQSASGALGTGVDDLARHRGCGQHPRSDGQGWWLAARWGWPREQDFDDEAEEEEE